MTTRCRVGGSSDGRPPPAASPVEVVLIAQIDQLRAADPLERLDVLGREPLAPAAGAAAGEGAAAGRPDPCPDALQGGAVQRPADMRGDARDGRALVLLGAAA